MFKEFEITGLEDTFFNEKYGTVIGKISKGVLLNDNGILYLKFCDNKDIFDLGDIESLSDTIRASELDDELKQEISIFLEVEYGRFVL